MADFFRLSLALFTEQTAEPAFQGLSPYFDLHTNVLLMRYRATAGEATQSRCSTVCFIFIGRLSKRSRKANGIERISSGPSRTQHSKGSGTTPKCGGKPLT